MMQFAIRFGDAEMPLLGKALRRRSFARFFARACILLFFPVPIRAAPVPHLPCSANNALPIVAATDSTGLMLTSWMQELSDSLGAEVAVACRDLHTGREFFFNEKKMMHAASTMKVPVMIEAFRQAQAGRFRLEDSLLVRNDPASSTARLTPLLWARIATSCCIKPLAARPRFRAWSKP